MFWEILKFECRYQARSPLFLILTVVFFLLSFLAMASERVSIGGVGSNLNLNANFTVIVTQYVLGLFGMLPAVAIVASAVTRDYEAKTAELFFSSGVSERAFLFGRFTGGVLFSMLFALGMLFGTLLGTFMPWLDQERIGAFSIAPYWYSISTVIVPTYFVVCSIFFAVAALSRSMLYAFVASLGLIVAYVVVAANTDQETIGITALLEPFGIISFSEMTRYWTVAERNYAVPDVAGPLLINRLIWLGVGLVALFYTAWRYRFNLNPGFRFRRKKLPKIVQAPEVRTVEVSQVFGFATTLAQFASQLKMDVRGVLKSIPFYIILGLGLFNTIAGFFGVTGAFYGTDLLPVTGALLTAISGTYTLTLIMVVIWYSGDLIYSERQAGVADILDATPYVNGILVLSKIAALWFVITVLYLVAMGASMLMQVFNDYQNFEIGLYLQGLLFNIGGGFYIFAVVAVFVQVLARNKYVGMLAFLVLFLGLGVLNSFGYEHNLYQLPPPVAPFSDMNQFGHYFVPLLAFTVYWALFCVVLIAGAHLMFRRGNVYQWSERLNAAKLRWNAGVASISLIAVLAFGAVGSWIFYNTNVLNEYTTADEREERQADYEKAYKQFETMPRPEVLDISAEVDIFPEERRLESRGQAVLFNKLTENIDELHLSVSLLLTVNAIEMPGAELTDVDEVQGYYQYRLVEPLAPGERRTLSWDLTWTNPGFPNSGSTTRVVANGTFVNNTEIMPQIGYNSGRELSNPNDRREYDLPPVQRLPKYGDPEWLDVSQMGVSERTDFRTIVSTVGDQIAVAPGYLQREWEENGRRYFEYEMDAPIWPFVSYSSARYEVARDEWRSSTGTSDDVAIEVYYHPGHGYNVENMIRGTKKSLDYFTQEFSPYQYRQFRILEFPRYATFAQSFPNTIPYSEGIGFIADLRDEEDIDVVFYVTAHELAHQWWAHQVIGARMQGMTVLVETLAQYSALMVMEREYGPEKIRRFLKYELDNYLRSRGGELIEELPLSLVENQPYIHYRKGSVVMYALKDAIGEDKMNLALRRLIDKFAFKSSPFPTTGDLLAEIRAVARPEHQKLITDLFERITLYDLKVAEASVEETANGYDVTVTVEAKQFEADGKGVETEVPLEVYVDIAAFPEASGELAEYFLPEPLYVEKHLLTTGSQSFTFSVSEQPEKVGVDPYTKLIDRYPDDNMLDL